MKDSSPLIVIAVFLAVVLWAGEKARSEQDLKVIHVPEPVPEAQDLVDQWRAVSSLFGDADGEYAPAASPQGCVAMVLELERLRDMLIESSRVKDEWSAEDQRIWGNFWYGYVTLGGYVRSCANKIPPAEFVAAE